MRSVKDDRAFGFILSDEDGKSHFVHIKHCVAGVLPKVGDKVVFDLKPSERKPGFFECVNVSVNE